MSSNEEFYQTFEELTKVRAKVLEFPLEESNYEVKERTAKLSEKLLLLLKTINAFFAKFNSYSSGNFYGRLSDKNSIVLPDRNSVLFMIKAIKFAMKILRRMSTEKSYDLAETKARLEKIKTELDSISSQLDSNSDFNENYQKILQYYNGVLEMVDDDSTVGSIKSEDISASSPV